MRKYSEILKEKFYGKDWVHPYKIFEQKIFDHVQPNAVVLDVGCGRTAPVLNRLASIRKLQNSPPPLMGEGRGGGGKLTKTFPKEEMYGLTNQIRRSAVSIPSNIAEGYMRGSKEYIQFLKIALGSAAELETQLSLSKDLGFCDNNAFDQIYGLNQEVIKLLKTYIKRIGDSV